ncbi:DUF4279 domain-containing protein [Herbiconiux sp. P15]|uniref:DUF4279 domain-containing protein n=1 Tax=Herbiconiux liukaitaii TaxID=3342799 RepID=UPI0035B856D1
MIESGRATFSVRSTETAPEQITAVLGVEPTTVVLAGTERPSGGLYRNNQWAVDGAWSVNTKADHTGTGALRELLVLLRPAAGKVQALPEECDARIWWSADSDSTQGGFVLPVDLSQAIAEFGVDVYATVYLDADGVTGTEGT